jgi:hypothetical protein
MMGINALTKLLLTAAIAAALAGCQGANGGPSDDSETHWYAPCEADAGCSGGLSCLCGVCTVPCDEAGACDGDTTACLPQSAVAACKQPGAAGLCAIGCAADADCASAGASATCSGGVCIVDAGGEVPQGPGSPGTIDGPPTPGGGVGEPDADGDTGSGDTEEPGEDTAGETDAPEPPFEPVEVDWQPGLAYDLKLDMSTIALDPGSKVSAEDVAAELAAGVQVRVDAGPFASVVGTLHSYAMAPTSGGTMTVEPIAPVDDLTFNLYGGSDEPHVTGECSGNHVGTLEVTLRPYDTDGDGVPDRVAGTAKFFVVTLQGNSQSISGSGTAAISGDLDATAPTLTIRPLLEWPDTWLLVESSEPLGTADVAAALVHKVGGAVVPAELLPVSGGISGVLADAWRIALPAPGDSYALSSSVTARVESVADAMGNASAATAVSIELPDPPQFDVTLPWDFGAGNPFDSFGAFPGESTLAPGFESIAAPTGNALAVVPLTLDAASGIAANLTLPGDAQTLRIEGAIAEANAEVLTYYGFHAWFLTQGDQVHQIRKFEEVAETVTIDGTTWGVTAFGNLDLDVSALAGQTGILVIGRPDDLYLCSEDSNPKGDGALLIDRISVLP